MRRSAFKRFGFSVVAVAAVLVLHLALAPWLGDSGLFLLFTPAVMFSAWYGGLGPGLLSMALSVAAGWNFLMAPGGLSIDDWDRLALFLIVGGAVTWLQVKIASSTDRIQALLERAQEARAEAEAANRAKDEFLATVSHELRAPLSVVIGWASVLRRDPGAGAVVNRAADAIESNARLQARLVEDILDSVRASRGTLQLEQRSVDLVPLIHGVVDAFQPTVLAQGLDLRVESRRDSIVVWGDSSRLQQVLMNLLTNASKFTPPGGSIDVRLESAGHEARLLVEDSGIGIEPHLLPHVFEPFRKGKDSSTGLGLGLAIVTHIVEMHGGRVTAASAGRGCGTSITLALPLMAAAERGGRRTEA